jgi:hypothetical protein
MGNWNDAEIAIGLSDTHRLANIFAIGQELFAPEPDCARRSGCAGGKFEK